MSRRSRALQSFGVADSEKYFTPREYSIFT